MAETDCSDDLLDILDRELTCKPCQKGDCVRCTNSGVFLPSKEQTPCLHVTKRMHARVKGRHEAPTSDPSIDKEPADAAT